MFDNKITTCVLVPSTLGVVILKDKLNGLPFNKAEEEAFRVFATFCGLGVQNVVNYEEILKANAKQTVALDVSGVGYIHVHVTFCMYMYI